MKSVSLFCLLLVLLSSCIQRGTEGRVYTEKDIEGYWATNSVMQNSEWTASFAGASNRNVQFTLLRLYNDVCGIEDTCYKVHNDTLLLPEFNIEIKALEFLPSHLIEFVSAERIVLRELKTGLEITYYSLWTLPSSKETCDSFRLTPTVGGVGLMAFADSVTSAKVESSRDICVFGRTPDLAAYKTDSSWFARLNQLYSRMRPEELLFPVGRVYYDRHFGNCILPAPRPPGTALQLKGSRGYEYYADAMDMINPVVRAITLELSALEAVRWRDNDFLYL